MRQFVVTFLVFLVAPAVFADLETTKEIELLEEKIMAAGEREKLELLDKLAEKYLSISPQKSLEVAATALKIAQASNDIKAQGLALVRQSYGHSWLGDAQKSLEAGQKALELCTSVKNDECTYLSKMAIAAAHAGLENHEQSMSHALEALEMAKSAKDTDRLPRYTYNIGRAYFNQNNFGKALEYFLEALRLAELADDQMLAVDILNSTGTVYVSREKFDSALKYFGKTCKIAEEIGNKVSWSLCLSNIANVHSRKLNHTLALEFSLRALKILEEIGNKSHIAYALGTIAVTYRELGKNEEAVRVVERALELAIESGNKETIASTFSTLGEQFVIQGAFNKAKSYFEKSLKLSEELNMAAGVWYNLRELVKVLKKQGNFREALEIHERYFDKYNQHINEKSNRQINQLQVKYDTLKKESENARLETQNQLLIKDNQFKSLLRNVLVAGLVLVLIVLAVVIQRYRYLFTFWKRQKYIGRYRLEKRIGSGGMGNVFRAHDIRRKSESVAIKVLREEFLEDPVFRLRFKQEANLADKLSHPNIVRIIERGDYNGKLFIAMELLRGNTLQKAILEGGPLAFENILGIMQQIVDALALVHSKGITHRDLKPSNIMLTNGKDRTEVVKLLDFGLARQQFQTTLTKTGELLGTVFYMAPEQLMKGETSPASDIYSLGAICFEMLTGQKPFDGESEIKILKSILDQSPPALRELRADVPTQLNDLVSSMMAKHPQERPTAREVSTRLDEATRDLTALL